MCIFYHRSAIYNSKQTTNCQFSLNDNLIRCKDTKFAVKTLHKTRIIGVFLLQNIQKFLFSPDRYRHFLR